MRIAVIADTHDRVPPAVLQAIAGAEEIWHLGDVVSPGILERIREIGPPVHVVRGNCDSQSEWPLTLTFELGELRFHLIHVPPRVPPPDIDVLLHGHTHVPRNEAVDGVRFLNPGCITRPNRGAPASFAWLDIQGKGKWTWTPVPLAGLPEV